MLEQSRGPVLIEDFPDDDPREAADPAWQPPSARVEGVAADGAALADELAAELHGLASAYAQSCIERGRSTVGLSGLAPAACADYVVAWLRGPSPASPIPDMSPVLALRFVSDDLKAFALEAALAGGAKPSSRQLGDWLWNQTALGTALHALRRQLLAGDDERAKAVAAFFVPALRLPPGS